MPLQTEEILVDISRIGEREQSDLCPLSISDKWQNETKTENEKKWSAISVGIKCTREREIPLANLWGIILYIFVTDAWFGFFICAKKSQQIILWQSPPAVIIQNIQCTIYTWFWGVWINSSRWFICLFTQSFRICYTTLYKYLIIKT